MKEKRRSSIIEDWYWAVVFIAVLSSLVLACLLPAFLPQYIWFSQNFIPTMAGVVFTLIFVTILFEQKEKRRWAAVKEVVFNGLKIELKGIFIDLSNMCETKAGHAVTLSHEPTAEEIEVEFDASGKEQLDELKTAKKIELNDIYKESLSKGFFIQICKIREDRLSWVELKYSKFLSPELIKSLIIIQNNLDQLQVHMSIQAQRTPWSVSDERFFKNISENIRLIMKELGNINETELCFLGVFQQQKHIL